MFAPPQTTRIMKHWIYPTVWLLAALLLAACDGQNSRQAQPDNDSTAQPMAAGLFSSETQRDTRGTGNDASLSAIVPARRSDLPEQRLQRMAYVNSFNTKTLQPNWVAWRLTREHTKGNLKRDRVKFMEDEDVAQAYRVTTFDYNRSGYDRGHMCPAGDNKWNSKALNQCFLMTNICPQGHQLNAGDWNDLEIQCRGWARRYGEIYIICGPIFRGSGQRKIGRKARRVTVPDAFFKVVVCLKGQPKGIGFIYENEDGHRPMSHYVRSIDDVERITGYDFLAGLPDQTERALERSSDLKAW